MAVTIFGGSLSPSVASASPHWSKTRLKAEVREAAHYLGMSKTSSKKLQAYAVDIVFIMPGKPAHESGGSWYAGNGGCRGIFQFNGGWHLPKSIKAKAKKHHWHYHNGDWRLNAHAATHRFVWTYKHGGMRSLHGAWAATLNR